MEDHNNQGENSSRHVQQLLPPEPHHFHSQTISHTNNSDMAAEGGSHPSPNRRARGRPPGSKNKPKPPTLVMQDNPYILRSHMLQFSTGADIMESLYNYARRRGLGISVLNGSGTVLNVTIRKFGSVVTFNGVFEIVSITGMVLPPQAPPGIGGLSILLLGQGQVFGGTVVGPLIATSTVNFMVASFTNVVFERLPLDDEEAAHEDTGGGASQGHQVQPNPLDVDLAI